jgi:hypothetical protein
LEEKQRHAERIFEAGTGKTLPKTWRLEEVDISAHPKNNIEHDVLIVRAYSHRTETEY